MTTLARSRLHGMINHGGIAATRARRTRLAWMKLAVLVLTTMMIAVLVTGCASTSDPRVVEYNYESPNGRQLPAPGQSRLESSSGSSTHGSPPPMVIEPRPTSVSFDIPEDPDVLNEPVAPETQRLAAQSERDVQAVLNARNRTALTSVQNGVTSFEAGHSPESTSSAIGAAVPAPRRVIEWNDPPAPPIDTPTAAAPIDSPVGRADSISPKPVAPPSLNGPSPAAEEPSNDVTSTDLSPATLRPDRIMQLSVDLARELYAQGAYSDHPLRELAAIAAMGIQNTERRIDAAAIPDLTEEERLLLANLQTFFIIVGETLDAGSEVNAGIAMAAATLRQSLVHEPQLKLPRIAMCTRVGGFGDYSPFSKNMFLAGSDQRAIIYLEIEDFVSDINHNDEFVTELSQQLTIYSDRDGIPVWKEDWLSATDVTRNKRQDFFTTQIITLPKALSVGKYTLKIRVRDERSKAESETSIGFELVADPKMLN